MITKNSIKLFLFDLDGTLLDTLPDFSFHLYEILKKLPDSILKTESYSAPDLPTLESLNTRLRSSLSHGSEAMIQACFKSHHTRSELFLKQIYNQFIENYRSNLMYTAFFSGMQTVLNTLKRRQMPWGIVTNRLTHSTQLLLQRFTILQDSIVQVCGDTLATAKPHPEPLWFACKQAGIAPHQTLFIGDSELDLQAGRSAKIQTLFAAYGYGACLPDHDLNDSIEHPEDLLRWI